MRKTESVGNMILAGKCPPEEDEIEVAREHGFKHIELYITKGHLSNLDSTLRTIRNSDVNVLSVHTPHVTQKDGEWIKKADKLAFKLDSYLVVHSQHILNIKSSEIEEKGLKADHGYENNPGTSYHCLKNSILDLGYDLVLDLAHLYMAEREYLEVLNELMDDYHDQVEVVHLADSTKITDGLGFGEGKINIEEAIKTIRKHNFEGNIVLEVMPEKQKKAKTEFEKYFTV